MRIAALESPDSSLRADCVSLIQVIAHVYDIDAAFTAASRARATSGVGLTETWNGASLTARVFGKHWHEWSPPSIRHAFTERSLDHLAARFGLTRIAGGCPAKSLLHREHKPRRPPGAQRPSHASFRIAS